MDARQASEPATSSMLVLADGTQHAIPGGGLSIGRLQDNDLVLEDPQVSRRHAQIYHRDAALHIKDLGSFNGTKLNGARLTGEAQLADGDVLQLGDTVLTFRVHRPGTDIGVPVVPAEPAAEAAFRSAVISLSSSERPGVEPGPPRDTAARLAISASTGEASAQLRLRGVLDIETADLFREQTRQLLDSGATQFTLDLSDLEYVDSSGLGALVWLNREAKERDGSVCLEHLQPAVRGVVELTRLSRIFSIQ